MNRDSYYDVLGVPFDASKEQIKRAYRRLAKEHHPDSAAESDSGRFRRAQEAYETLSDDSARRRYDARLLHSSGRRGPQHRGRTWESDSRHGRRESWWRHPGRESPFEDAGRSRADSFRAGGFESLESLLRRFMSGMAGAHPQRISFDLVLSPFEAEAGVTVPLDLAELFPGSGREELVRFAIPGNRQQGDILTGTIEGRFGGSYEIEFRVVVRD